MSNYFEQQQQELGYNNIEMLYEFVKEDSSGDDMDYILGDDWFEDFYEVRQVFIEQLYSLLSDLEKKDLEKMTKKEYGFERGFSFNYQV